MPQVIDSHQHFWKYREEQYPWIGAGMDVLRRDFLPPDLHREMHKAGIDASVAVQACQTIEETEWLLGLANDDDSITGVVGWAPLIDARVETDIEHLQRNTKLKGLRHVLHDERDDFYMLGSDFNSGIGALHRYGLVYDILIYERHLPQTIEFVDRHPNQVFVLDHIAKPRIRDASLSPWRDQMAELAKRENVYCKLSGVVTEANWKSWQPGDLDPYFDVVLNAFTPKRLMFGSDWPVLLVASGYEQWRGIVEGATAALSSDERRRIWGETAIEVYNL